MTPDQKAREAALAAFRKSTYDALTIDECRDAANAAIDAYLAAPLPEDVEAVCEGLEEPIFEPARQREPDELILVTEIHGSHCSCHGLSEDPYSGGPTQWQPEETTVEAIRHRLDSGTWGEEGNVADYVRAALKEHTDADK